MSMNTANLGKRVANKLAHAFTVDCSENTMRSVSGGAYRILSEARGWPTSWINRTHGGFTLHVRPSAPQQDCNEVMEQIAATILMMADDKELERYRQWYGAKRKFIHYVTRNRYGCPAIQGFSIAKKFDLRQLPEMTKTLRNGMRDPAQVEALINSIKNGETITWQQRLSFQ